MRFLLEFKKKKKHKTKGNEMLKTSGRGEHPGCFCNSTDEKTKQVLASSMAMQSAVRQTQSFVTYSHKYKEWSCWHSFYAMGQSPRTSFFFFYDDS